MRTIDRRAYILGAALLLSPGLGHGAALAQAAQSQDQPAHTSGKKPDTRKSSSRELSEEQGGARGFALPGDESESKSSAKNKAHKAKAGDKTGKKAAPAANKPAQ